MPQPAQGFHGAHILVPAHVRDSHTSHVPVLRPELGVRLNDFFTSLAITLPIVVGSIAAEVLHIDSLIVGSHDTPSRRAPTRSSECSPGCRCHPSFAATVCLASRILLMSGPGT